MCDKGKKGCGCSACKTLAKLRKTFEPKGPPEADGSRMKPTKPLKKPTKGW